MANIKKIILEYKKEPYGCIRTSIGDLCVFYHSANDEIEVEKALGKPINKCKPIDFVRKLVQHICFPKSKLKEGKYKPDNPILTNDDILSLTESDLEAISKLYVENSEYLFKKTLWKEKTDNEGKKISYTEYGEIKYPHNEGENYVQYLTRLFLNKEKEQKMLMENAINSLGFNNFSGALEKNIKDTLLLGDSLRKTIQGIRPIEMAEMRPIETGLPKIDSLNIEETMSSPFNDIAGRLDKLIESSDQATEFVIQANEIQTRIAGEIKSSSDQATILSKKNIRLTYVVVILSIISLVFLTISLVGSINARNIQRAEIEKHVNALSDKLTDINNSIAVANKKTFDLLENNYISINKLLMDENENLKKQIIEQKKMLDEMKTILPIKDEKLEN